MPKYRAKSLPNAEAFLLPANLTSFSIQEAGQNVVPGKPGDYLVRNADGTLRLEKKTEFEAIYESEPVAEDAEPA